MVNREKAEEEMGLALALAAIVIPLLITLSIDALVSWDAARECERQPRLALCSMR